MRRNCVIFVLSCLVLSCLFLIYSSSQSSIRTSPLSPSNKNTLNEKIPFCKAGTEEEGGLGENVAVDWSGSGRGDVDALGRCSIGDLKINGPSNEDIFLRFRIRATIGSYEAKLPEFELHVPAGKQVDVPIDHRFAKNLLDMQKEFNTSIMGYVERLDLDEGHVIHSQRLAPRYLVYNSSAEQYELMDRATRDQNYPHGYSSKEGQSNAQNVIDENDKDEIVDAVLPASIFKSMHMTPKEQEAFLASRTEQIEE